MGASITLSANIRTTPESLTLTVGSDTSTDLKLLFDRIMKIYKGKSNEVLDVSRNGMIFQMVKDQWGEDYLDNTFLKEVDKLFGNAPT